MNKTGSRMFAEKLLYDHNLEALLLGDYAYSKKKAKKVNSRYTICNHWVDKKSERKLSYYGKRYYIYTLTRQWN